MVPLWFVDCQRVAGDLGESVEREGDPRRREGRIGRIGVEPQRVLAGRVDVAVGGTGTDLPAVLIENKAGRWRHHHHAELVAYGLLFTLLDGRLPAFLVGCTGGGTVIAVRPTADLLVAAAHRAADAIGRLVALADGAVPQATGNPTCLWCPLLGRCFVGQTHVANDGEEPRAA